jgi:adenylate cyclase
LADYDRGLSLNPNVAIHLIHAAWGESLAGVPDKAKQHAELALRLSPKEMDLFLGFAYLALLQACFAERDFSKAMHWGRLSIQLHARAPIRLALMIACCAYMDDLYQVQKHAQNLAEVSPEFLSSLIRGDLVLFRESSHNKLLVDGISRSGCVIL